jgi:UPF0176 protein
MNLWVGASKEWLGRPIGRRVTLLSPSTSSALPCPFVCNKVLTNLTETDNMCAFKHQPIGPELMNHSIINVSAYRFVTLDSARLNDIKADLLSAAQSLNLKGTVLLSTEGINLFVAGEKAAIDAFFNTVNGYEELANLPRKDSLSKEQPFTRMLVRIKKEIISMGCQEVQPEQHTATHLDAKTFHQWYQDQKEMIILDTRNDYEVKLGTFEQAIDLDIKNFRDFPSALKKLPEALKDKPIVTFCTGGIRCEKAAELMQQQGFTDVYQLDGGILKYFEECQGEYYDGECFVFDKRVALDKKLNETQTTQCFACRMPLKEALKDDEPCPYCDGNPLTGEKATSLAAAV